jgi:hypothetical protein
MAMVTLAPHEIQMGAEVAVRRRVSAIEHGMTDAHGYNGEQAWEQEVTSCLAEMAVAKCLGRYWDGGVDTFKRGDVGRLQVRFTKRTDGRLIIRRSDKQEDVFVLVVGFGPTSFEVVGWIRGSEAREDRWLTNMGNGRPECWAVPRHALKKIEAKGGDA